MARIGWLRRAAPDGVSVVTYHGVQPEGYVPLDSALDGNLVSADMLARHLRLLKTNYEVIAPDDFRSWLAGASRLPDRAVLITCDDGLLNVFTDMLPILVNEGVKCLFFVTGASAADTPSALWYEQLFLAVLRAPAGKFHLATPGVQIEDELGGAHQRRAVWWRIVQRLSQEDGNTRGGFVSAARQMWPGSLSPEDEASPVPLQRRFRLLTPAQLVQLQDAGMTIGAHTMTHPVLSRQPLPLAQHEISDARSVLESLLARRVWAFAYPFGDSAAVDPQAFVLARDAGFEAGFLNYGGGFCERFDHFAIPRVHVTSTMGLAEFEAHVAGLHTFLQRYAGRTLPGGSMVAAG
jgi:peptidoglycan/xylan/chitin deacetylase (PgdA/CDA1 family)